MPEERDADGDRETKTLATWETGVQGLQWLYGMVAAGTAREHALRGGYPNRYIASARDLLPLLREDPPLSPGINVCAYDEAAGKDRLVPGDRNWSVTLRADRIAVCPPWKLLIVEVWDLS